MIKLVLTIIDVDLKNDFKKICEECSINTNVYSYGEGIASSEVLDMLGMTKTQKIVIFSLVNEQDVTKFWNELINKMNINKKGRGISFTFNTSGIDKKTFDYFKKSMYYNKQKDDKQIIDNPTNKEGDNSMSDEKEYELIVTIMEADYLDEAKNAVVEAGAKGGTSVRAIGLGSQEASKFLGITINPEKEIMLNVVAREDKENIMNAICKKVGVQTAGKGICFSLPVDKAIGLV